MNKVSGVFRVLYKKTFSPFLGIDSQRFRAFESIVKVKDQYRL